MSIVPRTGKLSPKQLEALKMMDKHGGALERREGGYWTYQPPYTEPLWWAGTRTVYALLDRGLIEEVQTDERVRSRAGAFQSFTAVRLTKAGKSAANDAETQGGASDNREV